MQALEQIQALLESSFREGLRRINELGDVRFLENFSPEDAQ